MHIRNWVHTQHRAVVVVVVMYNFITNRNPHSVFFSFFPRSTLSRAYNNCTKCSFVGGDYGLVGLEQRQHKQTKRPGKSEILHSVRAHSFALLALSLKSLTRAHRNRKPTIRSVSKRKAARFNNAPVEAKGAKRCTNLEW